MVLYLLSALLGIITFPTLFKFIGYSLPSSISDGKKRMEISERCVSAFQALTAVAVGLITMKNTGDDIVYSRFMLLDYYVCFWIPYFYYDTWADYKIYLSKAPSSVTNSDFLTKVKSFVKSQPLMMLHHFGLPLIFGPSILYFRHGKGDYLIGCAITMQATIPFISIRSILLELNMKYTRLYVANGMMLAVSFGIFRVLLWFYLIHTLAVYRDIPFIDALLTLPRICFYCTFLFLCLNSYWFIKILLTVKRSLREIYVKSKTDDLDKTL